MPAETDPTRDLFLQLDLVNKCNLRCRMCHFADENVFNAPRVEISMDEFHRLTDEVLPRVRSAMLSCATEPLMGKTFLEALRATRASGVPFIEFVTNATLFRTEHLRTFFEERVNRVQISIDGASERVFEDIRVGAKYRVVVRNIRRLTRLRERLGVSYPTVRLNQVLFLHNVDEAEAFVRMAKELGADELDFRHVNLHPMMGLDDQSLWKHKARSNWFLGRARRLADELGLRVFRWPVPFELDEAEARELARLEAEDVQGSTRTDWRDVPEYEKDEELFEELRGRIAAEGADREVGPEPGLRSPDWLRERHADLGLDDATLRAGYERCPLPFEFVLVNADSRVAPCPFWPHEESMGNVTDASLEEVWTNATYRELRRSLATGELQRPCVQCPNLGRGAVDDERAFKDRVF